MAVGRDHVLGSDRVRAGRVGDDGRHAVGVLLQGVQLGGEAQVGAELLGLGPQHPLDLGLRRAHLRHRGGQGERLHAVAGAVEDDLRLGVGQGAGDGDAHGVADAV